MGRKLSHHGFSWSSTQLQNFNHDTEKVRQLRSRLIEILNVPLRVRLRFRFACGLAGRSF